MELGIWFQVPYRTVGIWLTSNPWTRGSKLLPVLKNKAASKRKNTIVPEQFQQQIAAE
jgi:hypothetical protein